jgi:hypothetical protein
MATGTGNFSAQYLKIFRMTKPGNKIIAPS